MRDSHVALGVLAAVELSGPVAEAAELLALVAGQDVEVGEDGIFRIARMVARDRVISTMDTQARHGHKSRARTFDGDNTHQAVDADADDELVSNVAVPPTPKTAQCSTKPSMKPVVTARSRPARRARESA